MSSIHPQGWVPIETVRLRSLLERNVQTLVAFTPKGGCPLKREILRAHAYLEQLVAFTPKGGCPLKLNLSALIRPLSQRVAFTPKGGCPLKLHRRRHPTAPTTGAGSIHPQGWVPIETNLLRVMGNLAFGYVAFTPKGGCPLKPDWLEELMRWYWFKVVAFTPKGGCPLKL